MPAATSFDDFTDIEAFLRIPRVTAVAAGPTGRVVAQVAESDEHGSKLCSALWELDPTGQEPARRLTFSAKGESNPLFAPDGRLLFTSARPDPQGEDEQETSAIWRLPTTGEASVVATTPGGLDLLAVADDGTILATTTVLPGATLDTDAEARKARKDAKRTTIWHTGMPVRFWDHEVDDLCTHLVLIAPDGDLHDLTPAVGTVPLRNASADLAPDGSAVASTWTERVRGGETRTSIALIDVATGERRLFLPADPTTQYGGPALSRDGRYLAVTRYTIATPTDTTYPFLEIHPVAGGPKVAVDVGDLTVTGYTWTEAGTLLVTGDLHSSGAVLVVDPDDGQVVTIADGGVYASLSACGDQVVALRSDVATPARPVLLAGGEGAAASGTGGNQGLELPAPGLVSDLPGTLEWVSADVDGIQVGGWLCVPHGASADEPAPVMLWVHGGPHGSYNAWSWRWCPWLAVARGYAVLLPDPAMSTGYGHTGLNRGWPRRPDVVYRECEVLFDQVLTRAELDERRTAMLGASFGGFMANWIAGHTDRFDAIVTHAGLWALDQQHRTTDAAAGKMRVHGHEETNADWYRAFSPHHAAANITTPVLITHGNRDYRVPISEALRMWWDLVSAWDGEPETMPHRFLQLTDENHWVLTPANALTWNTTVLAFCDQHVRGGEPVPETLPW
nr:alpha/beta fold hydrolase [Ruania albidiflava]